jgi:glucokinase
LSKKKFAVGVDLGGTNIKIGLVDEKGKISKRISIDSCAEKGPDKVIHQIKTGIKEILKKSGHKIIGIGIGAPGAVKLKKGTVENPPNFPGWGKIHLGNILKKEFKLDVFVENDANAAAIGELIYGSGKLYKDFVLITLGTGVGSGIISGKKIFRGETGFAGEIGHLSIDFKGSRCKCGSIGCIESYIGNSYLVENTKKQLAENKSSAIFGLTGGDLNLLTPKIINEAAAMGDEFAKSVVEEAGTKLGYALSSVVHVLDITTFVIGGGLAGFGKLLFEAVESAAKERVMKPFKDRIIVKPARLKNDAGIKGASALVFYKS